MLQDAVVDLGRSLIREVEEETGLTAEDFTLVDEWIRVESDMHFAFFKDAQLKWSRLEVSDPIEKFLAEQIDPEPSDVVLEKKRQVWLDSPYRCSRESILKRVCLIVERLASLF